MLKSLIEINTFFASLMTKLEWLVLLTQISKAIILSDTDIMLLLVWLFIVYWWLMIIGWWLLLLIVDLAVVDIDIDIFCWLLLLIDQINILLEEGEKISSLYIMRESKNFKILHMVFNSCEGCVWFWFYVLYSNQSLRYCLQTTCPFVLVI